jgi:hypothetical protein
LLGGYRTRYNKSEVEITRHPSTGLPAVPSLREQLAGRSEVAVSLKKRSVSPRVTGASGISFGRLATTPVEFGGVKSARKP